MSFGLRDRSLAAPDAGQISYRVACEDQMELKVEGESPPWGPPENTAVLDEPPGCKDESDSPASSLKFLENVETPPEFRYKFDATLSTTTSVLPAAVDSNGRASAEHLCSYPGVSWNTRMQSWLVYYEDMNGRRSKTFNPKRYTAEILSRKDRRFDALRNLSPLQIAMHCACAFAADVRYKAHLYKILGFKVSRTPRHVRGIKSGKLSTSPNLKERHLKSSASTTEESSLVKHPTPTPPDDPMEDDPPAEDSRPPVEGEEMGDESCIGQEVNGLLRPGESRLAQESPQADSSMHPLVDFPREQLTQPPIKWESPPSSSKIAEKLIQPEDLELFTANGRSLQSDENCFDENAAVGTPAPSGAFGTLDSFGSKSDSFGKLSSLNRLASAGLLANSRPIQMPSPVLSVAKEFQLVQSPSRIGFRPNALYISSSPFRKKIKMNRFE